MNEMSMEIGNRIQLMRKKQAMTQEQLAEYLDITIKHISAVERGLSSLSLEKLIRVAYLFDCSLDYLVFGNNENVIQREMPQYVLNILNSKDNMEKDLLLQYLFMYRRLRKGSNS